MRSGRLAHKHTLALSLAAYGHELSSAPKSQAGRPGNRREAAFLGIGWTLVLDSFEVLVFCTDAPKALKLLPTFRGRASPRVKAKMHEKR